MKKATSALFALAALVARADLDYLNYAVRQDPAAVTVTFASAADSRGFTWFTTQDVASGEVAVLPGSFGSGDDAAFDASPRRVAAAVVAADDDGRPINVFSARVYGLPAGGYSFRLGSAGHYRYGTFTVRAKPSEVTIVNLSDAQTRDATRLWKWERSCQAVASTVAPGAIDFIVNGGDHFDGAFLDAGDNTIPANQSGHCRYFQWAIATDAMNQFLSDVPVLWTSGNHDYYKGYEFTAEDWAVTNASTYGCHSFDYGPVHFASIPWPSSKNNVDRDTVSWLEADLGAVKRRSDIKWRIVSMHAGPYTTGDNTRDEAYTNVVAKISAICSQHNVDLVLQAHDHTYSKTLPYRWDAAGFTTSETDGAVVNLSPVRAELDGEVWDVDPNADRNGSSS